MAQPVAKGINSIPGCEAELLQVQETTAFTAVTQYTHHGMIFCPPGYSWPGGKICGLDVPHGGSPWGAGTFAAGDGIHQPSDMELEV